jgi:hypothetical protein
VAKDLWPLFFYKIKIINRKSKGFFGIRNPEVNASFEDVLFKHIREGEHTEGGLEKP